MPVKELKVKNRELKVKGVQIYLGNEPEDPTETTFMAKFSAERVRGMIADGELELENIKTVQDFDVWLETILGKEEFSVWQHIHKVSIETNE